ncbi:CRAL/TRIO domain-containing protein [Fomitiporia mediterranea MF3/22]|uniref:CRAL/TRIO domain-containing protein n=1 Tax=Fomitiporia mediterranea (strain MF3/22) TaxID=694068 RepID=UPI0004408F2C|nr:CRAL/TRIO domain-containing protein [Fomitiporia mediterranea MF3/22]EJC98013.1 CRAL/TRIO domain-containing protein [Fomitiporia mediterranea MF3/22]
MAGSSSIKGSGIQRSFKGHLGRLTPEQEKAFVTFKANLEKAGLYTPPTEATKASHDDATLLRFLRARRFDPAKAQKQFSDRIAWEKKHDVHNLFANFPADEFESSRRYYPRWTGRRDREGLPLYVYKLSALSNSIQEEITSVPPQRRYERIVVLYEVMIRFVSPLCTYLPHSIEPTPIAAVTTIIDLAGVSARQMWSLRSHLQEASELANANYPETLGTVVVVNAPGFFSTVWGWIKGWFDENTREKIHVLGSLAGAESASSKELTSIISPSNIPRAYGGELDWDFFDEPSLDDEARQVIGHLPKGPWIFEDGNVKRPKEYAGSEVQHNAAESAPLTPSTTIASDSEQPVVNGNMKHETVPVESTVPNGTVPTI